MDNILPLKVIIGILTWSLFGLVIISQGCAGSKKWKKNIEGPIIFGSLGGFVGSFDEFTINQDGTVLYRSKLKGERQMVQQLDEEVKKSIFERIKSDEIYKEDVDEPGNMTYFLKFNYKSVEHHIQWGGQYDPSENLLGYYNFLKSHINNKNPVM